MSLTSLTEGELSMKNDMSSFYSNENKVGTAKGMSFINLKWLQNLINQFNMSLYELNDSKPFKTTDVSCSILKCRTHLKGILVFYLEGLNVIKGKKKKWCTLEVQGIRVFSI